MSKVFTRAEVAKHNTEDDLWCVIDNKVYDLTKFANLHPGGKGFLVPLAGKDATQEFFALHRTEILTKYARLVVGTISDARTPEAWVAAPGAISPVPYAESSFWQEWHSPYFNDGHRRFRVAVRTFFDTELGLLEAASLDEQGKDPTREFYQKMGKAGILAARIGPGAHLRGFQLPAGVSAQEFDYFHELIAHEELARLGAPGYQDGLGAGMVIGLPPVIHFGTPIMQKTIVPEVLSGDKVICLAISEPGAGSDVSNIQTTAVKSSCGRFFVVNGAKKWITNGSFSDYFVTAVRTRPGRGTDGISLLLIERGEGLSTKKIKTSYSASAGTAYVLYEDVRVPVENLLGEEHDGFKCIMANFNHERWLIICGVNRATRLVVEECLKWAVQRKVFGKPLMSQPVIRGKLAGMISEMEGVQNWLENVTYQMTRMSYAEQSSKLAGPIALLKLLSTRTSEHVLDEACQIFGGRAITRTGMGQVVERYNRAIKFGAILGGSEEIMADLGIRQAAKSFPLARL
eukprot:CAMPEP_0182864474 /NCGR_PEP_ID=MMETSP0034_2-20130328/7186_1 /TAXON_ID=156128 /ORGANISM="Nephroselmis pyriformis, Strain CCMP717" /LENGTH=515 /DNA_ID=CAMNT_0024996729 /DNA_START=72 /DNA_END=1619 /DNA_ORIENTATION=+